MASEMTETKAEYAAVQDRDQTRIEAELDDLERARSRLSDLLERAQRQLAKVQTPQIMASAMMDEPEMEISPLGSRIRNTTHELDAIRSGFTELLDSLDV